MVDNLTPEKRSWNMSRIRSKDTRPEKTVRSLLHSLGYRFRIHNKNLPGKPDIVLPKYNALIFIHGCYWHQHKNCKYASKPKTNKDYWTKKLKANVSRDREVLQKLKLTDWKVLIVWECSLKKKETIELTLNKISHWIMSNNKFDEIPN